MTYIYKVATLNINGITSAIRLRMLEEFLHKQDIDIILLQEVTDPNLNALHRYTTHINQGTDGRGTAILTKEGFTISNTKRLPSGGGIAATFNGVWMMNVCAPSEAEKKSEREGFYTHALPHLLPSTRSEMLLAGDFNCVLGTNDRTGHNNYSRALASIVHALVLPDMWDASLSRNGYTHYTPLAASRLDRIYVTNQLLSRKQGAETVATAFTDHFPVVLRLAIDIPLPLRQRILKDECILLRREGFP